MAETYSLFEFMQRLVTDDVLRADFAADPRATLAEHALADLSPQDVQDALVLVEDTHTAEFTPDHAETAAMPSAVTVPGGDAVHYFSAYVTAHTGATVDAAPEQHVDVDAVHGYLDAGHLPATDQYEADPAHLDTHLTAPQFGAGDAGSAADHGAGVGETFADAGHELSSAAIGYDDVGSYDDLDDRPAHLADDVVTDHPSHPGHDAGHDAGHDSAGH